MVPTSERFPSWGKEDRRIGGGGGGGGGEGKGGVLRSTSSSSSSVRNCRIHKRQSGLTAPEVRCVAWSEIHHQTKTKKPQRAFLKADPGEEAKADLALWRLTSLHRYHP